jgi:hypothetical protein
MNTVNLTCQSLLLLVNKKWQAKLSTDMGIPITAVSQCITVVGIPTSALTQHIMYDKMIALTNT